MKRGFYERVLDMAAFFFLVDEKLCRSVSFLIWFRVEMKCGLLSKCKVVKFHYLKKFIYITEIVNAHYFGVHIHYFGSDLLITITIVKFYFFTCRE